MSNIKYICKIPFNWAPTHSTCPQTLIMTQRAPLKEFWHYRKSSSFFRLKVMAVWNWFFCMIDFHLVRYNFYSVAIITTWYTKSLTPVHGELVEFMLNKGQSHLWFCVILHHDVSLQVTLGYNRKKLEKKHWAEMIENPRRPIIHWHVLKVMIGTKKRYGGDLKMHCC